jgi:hypothetical protein
MMKKFTALIIFILLCFICFPTTVFATHGFGSTPITIILDGQEHTIWGYGGDGTSPVWHGQSSWLSLYVRANDIAYILNGTDAQFDVNDTSDWFKRGMPYTVTGNEMQPISGDRYASFGSYGFVGGVGFYVDPIKHIAIAIDGETSPDTYIAMVAIVDAEGHVFFPIEDIGFLAGFDTEICWDTFNYTITPNGQNAVALPVQSRELVDLQILLSGRWVDHIYYESDFIDESVINPMQLFIIRNGEILCNNEYPTDWENVTVDGDVLIYNFDGNEYRMVRFDWDRNPVRYNVEITEDGYVKLSYVFRNWISTGWDITLLIYRSAVMGEVGELLIEEDLSEQYNRLKFEFIDTDVAEGEIYYYSIWVDYGFTTGHVVEFDDEWQIAVHVEMSVSTTGKTPVRYVNWVAFAVIVYAVVVTRRSRRGKGKRS